MAETDEQNKADHALAQTLVDAELAMARLEAKRSMEEAELVYLRATDTGDSIAEDEAEKSVDSSARAMRREAIASAGLWSRQGP